jgi:hypothetical protein
MESPTFLRLDLKPSPRLAALLGAAHFLALAAAWASLSGWPLAAVVAGILVSAAASLAEALHRAGRAAVSVELHEDGRAAWQDSRGGWHEARLGGGHFVAAGLVVMGLNRKNGRKWIVILPDSAPQEDLRRLRVWLRWRRAPGAQGQADHAEPQ